MVSPLAKRSFSRSLKAGTETSVVESVVLLRALVARVRRHGQGTGAARIPSIVGRGCRNKGPHEAKVSETCLHGACIGGFRPEPHGPAAGGRAAVRRPCHRGTGGAGAGCQPRDRAPPTARAERGRHRACGDLTGRPAARRRLGRGTVPAHPGPARKAGHDRGRARRTRRHPVHRREHLGGGDLRGRPYRAGFPRPLGLPSTALHPGGHIVGERHGPACLPAHVRVASPGPHGS